ncbi:MAG: fibronectin type III domain-containing protein [Spirochaetota bacterium]
MRLIRVLILLLLLLPLPLLAQEGPPLYIVTDGRNVHIILHNTPAETAGFKAYRRGPDDSAFLPMTTSTVTALSDPYQANELFQSDAEWLARRFETSDPVRLWRKIQVNRGYARAYSLVSPGLRMALGRTLVDRSVSTGRTYRYRIVLVDRRGAEIETLNRRITVKASDAVEAPSAVSAEQEGKDFLLEWDYRPYRGRTNDLTVGFHVYRRAVSKGGDGQAVRINDAPVLRIEEYLSYYDSAVQEGVRYRYGVQAVDMIGRVSEIVYSPAVEIKDTTPPLVPMGLTAIDADEGVRLLWNLSPEEDVRCYHVYRSDTFEGEFTRINAKPVPFDTPDFTDTRVVRGQAWFYRISAVDAAGNESAPCGAVTIIPADSEPPAAVSGLTGEVDAEKRSVRLRWDPSGEADLKGYFVYRMQADENMLRITPVPITPEKRPEFSDRSAHKQGLLPGAEYHYLVSAVDNSGNESARSSISLKIPDLVPPRKVFSFSARSTRDGHVELRWQPSLSRDLQTHRIFRMDDKGEPRIIAELEVPRTSYLDTAVERGREYTYYVVEVDAAGNSSEESRHRRVVPVDATAPGAPQELSARREKNSVLLNWRPPEDEDVVGYRIYRAAYPKAKSERIGPELIESNEYTSRFFTRAAEYTVRAVDSSGNEGEGISTQLGRAE